MTKQTEPVVSKESFDAAIEKLHFGETPVGRPQMRYNALPPIANSHIDVDSALDLEAEEIQQGRQLGTLQVPEDN